MKVKTIKKKDRLETNVYHAYFLFIVLNLLFFKISKTKDKKPHSKLFCMGKSPSDTLNKQFKVRICQVSTDVAKFDAE